MQNEQNRMKAEMEAPSKRLEAQFKKDDTSTLVTPVVRSALTRFAERRDQRILDLALAPGDPNEAQLCWGGNTPANPQNAGETSSDFGGGFNTRKSKEEPEKDPKEQKYVWSEKERFVVKTRITNPDDEEQYVYVNKCKVMVITAPSQEPFNGKIHVFNFQGKETVVGVDEGGSEGGGSESEDEEEEE
jgi:hypothetical protein